MPEYTVELVRDQKSQVDVDTQSPQEAALIALAQINDPEGDYRVVRVTANDHIWMVASRCVKCRLPIMCGAWFVTDDNGGYLCRKCSEVAG